MTLRGNYLIQKSNLSFFVVRTALAEAVLSEWWPLGTYRTLNYELLSLELIQYVSVGQFVMSCHYYLISNISCFVKNRGESYHVIKAESGNGNSKCFGVF